MMATLLLGGPLLVGCDEIKEPIESCVINTKFGAECGMRNFNIMDRTVGDWIGETRLEKIEYANNYVCVSGKKWSIVLKPKLKEVNTKYRQKKRKRR